MLDLEDRAMTDGDTLAETAAIVDNDGASAWHGAVDIARNRAEIDADPLIPDYLKEVYYWAYLDPRNVRLLDREIIVKLILWYQHEKLQRAAFSELAPGQKVLQPASVYGDFSLNLARHLGPDAGLEILDIAPIQVLGCREKTAHLPQVRVNRGNAANLGDRVYDAICCYFLLHEVPLEYKYTIVQEMLDHVRPGGKVVFVDYHEPHWAHPLRPITSLVFNRLEPFAKELWRHSIEELAEGDPRFGWRQQSFFGGLFQKVVAQRSETR
ncbi:MAG: rhodoquinone biosynthesis methyltransferase RquA [Gammaproteobacteria bacterium]